MILFLNLIIFNFATTNWDEWIYAPNDPNQQQITEPTSSSNSNSTETVGEIFALLIVFAILFFLLKVGPKNKDSKKEI